VFGGVGMSPQEQAFRRGTDVIVATPGRLLDHMQYPYVRFDGLEVLVLDEADRMLDMGFLPDIRRVLKQLPAKRQTLFFSATMPAPIVKLSHEMLHNPAAINLERKSRRPGHHAGGLPGGEELKAALFLELLRRGDVGSAIVFCRTKHRSNRLADVLDKAGSPRRASTATAARRRAPRRSAASRAASTACWWPRTSWRAASTSRRWSTW
jgi:ATP-dependent RNA helicase RhlE